MTCSSVHLIHSRFFPDSYTHTSLFLVQRVRRLWRNGCCCMVISPDAKCFKSFATKRHRGCLSKELKRQTVGVCLSCSEPISLWAKRNRFNLYSSWPQLGYVAEQVSRSPRGVCARYRQTHLCLISLERRKGCEASPGFSLTASLTLLQTRPSSTKSSLNKDGIKECLEEFPRKLRPIQN